MNANDLNQVPVSCVGSIGTNALKFMPSSTINAFSLSQMASLKILQVNALMSSPYYASFTSNITANLKSSDFFLIYFF